MNFWCVKHIFKVHDHVSLLRSALFLNKQPFGTYKLHINDLTNGEALLTVFHIPFQKHYGVMWFFSVAIVSNMLYLNISEY